MSSDTCTDDAEQAKTVLRWFGAHQRQHRIRVRQVPGSAHWNVLKDSRNSLSGDWERDWATEANTKPDFRSLKTDTEPEADT